MPTHQDVTIAVMQPRPARSTTVIRTTRSAVGRVIGALLVAVGSLTVATTTSVQANSSQIPVNPEIGGLVSVGNAHACYLTDGGTVKCWGRNNTGQLGVGNTTDVARGAETAVPGITTAVALTTAVGRSCALLADGSIRCWGSQSSGALGNGVTTGAATTPVIVSGIDNAVAVELNRAGTDGGACALTSTRQVWCWGSNSRGAVGDGTTTSAATPVRVSGLTDPIRLSSGWAARVACAVTEGATDQAVDNELWCWGENQAGQLTDGTFGVATGVGAFYTTPRRIMLDATTPLTGVVAAAVGGNNTCALLHHGEVWCWGETNGGRLGDGTTTPGSQVYPVRVMQDGTTSLSHTISVSATDGGFCVATLSVGTRGQRCWGTMSVTSGYATFIPNVTTSAVAHIMGASFLIPSNGGLNLDWCAVMDDRSLVCSRGSAASTVVATDLSGATLEISSTPASGGAAVLPPGLAPLVTAPVATPTSSTPAPSTTTPPPSTTSPSTTLAPVPGPSGNLPDLASGETLLIDNGVPAEAELVIQDESLVLRRSDFELRLSGACATGCSVDEDSAGRATITLVRSGQANVSGFGFLPGSLVHVWVFSQPRYLGALEVQADGTYSGSFPLADIEPGQHTLQASGISADNVARSANLGIVVVDPAAPSPENDTLPATGNTTTITAIALWATALTAAGVALTLTARRRITRRWHG